LQVLSIAFDSHGNKWFGTACGILEFNDYTASSISPHSQDEIFIWPNPTNSYININLSGQNCNNEISVLDIKGSLVFKKTVSSNNIQLDISNFKQGLYFVYVNNGPFRVLKQIIKYD
jgi:hypothetical protein